MDVQEIIRLLELKPHPEGGFFRETYRSELNITAPFTAEKRAVSTGIYFLLTAGNFSALHRIQSDEMWHFYTGDPIEIIELNAAGEITTTLLGNDFLQGQTPQYVVKAGNWFGSKVAGNGQFGLVGCTVSPGFDFNDFELAQRSEILQMFPQHQHLIAAWTRP